MCYEPAGVTGGPGRQRRQPAACGCRQRRPGSARRGRRGSWARLRSGRCGLRNGTTPVSREKTAAARRDPLQHRGAVREPRRPRGPAPGPATPPSRPEPARGGGSPAPAERSLLVAGLLHHVRVILLPQPAHGGGSGPTVAAASPARPLPDAPAASGGWSLPRPGAAPPRGGSGAWRDAAAPAAGTAGGSGGPAELSLLPPGAASRQVTF